MQDLTYDVFILIHLADACVLVMACVDCVRGCGEKPFQASLKLFLLFTARAKLHR